MVQVNQVHAGKLGLEEHLLSDALLPGVDRGRADAILPPTLVVERREVERLAEDELPGIAHAFLVAPEVRVGRLGVGEVILRPRLKFQGLGICRSRLYRFVVFAHETEHRRDAAIDRGRLSLCPGREREGEG